MKVDDGIGGKASEETKNVVMYHRGRVVERVKSKAEKALLDAVIALQRKMGLRVVTDVDGGQRVLDYANGNGVRMSAKKKRALETAYVSQSEEHQPTVVSSADGAKVLNNLKEFAEEQFNSSHAKEKTFLGDLAKALGAERHGSASEYATFETKNGKVVTIRLASHNAKVSNFDNRGEADGISIVISAKKSEGVTNDGEAHIVEYYYDAIALRRAEGKPLAEIVRSIEQALYSGEFKDTTGLAKRQEVNGEDVVRYHRVFHGSGADFEKFDHSHMGEGEGAQAFGWGTYVTEVEGIGRTYAHNSAMGDSAKEEMEYIGDVLTKKEADLVKYAFGGGMRTYHEVETFLEGIANSNKPGAQHSARALALLRKTRPTDWRHPLQDRRHLYTVEIPDDNGSNYLEWYGHPTSGRLGIISKLLEADGWVRSNDEHLIRLEKNGQSIVLNERTEGQDLYGELEDALGSNRKASELLHEAGFVGIKYPADSMRGGREDGKQNYVIFNEGDAKIEDHVRFFRTSDGEAYGFTVGGRIYIDPRVATSETAVHEYAHLWASALREGKGDEWQNVVGLMKGTMVWDEVKRLYPELKTDDDVADEVLARYSGRRGADRLREEMRRVMDGDGSLRERTAAVSALGRVKKALEEFWKGVADFLGIHYTTAEEVADRVMRDMLSGVDPTKLVKDGRVRRQIIGERGAERMDKAEHARERMDGLRLAREMEKGGEDAKAIKFATGWERGADGKWRYEIADLKYHPNGDAEYKKLKMKQPWNKELEELENRLLDGEHLSERDGKRFEELAERENKFKSEYLSREKKYLADWVENKALFDAYPELKRVELVFTDQMPKEEGGYYSEKDNRVVVNTASVMDIESVIAHEVQHAIQRIEGFSRGGSEKSVEREFKAAKAEWRARAYAHELAETAKELGGDYSQADVEKALLKEYREMGMSDWLPDMDTRIKGFNYFARGYADRSLDDAIKRFRLDESARADFNPYLEYRKLSGEVEARNVQKRMGLTQEERRRILMAETEDVAREDQMLLYGDGDAMSFGEPYDYEKYPLGRVEAGLTEKEVRIVDGEEEHGFKNYAEAKQWAKEHIVRTYENEETGGKGRVRISNTAIGKFLSESAVDKSDSKDVHMSVLKVLPEVLKTSIDAETHPDFLKGEDGTRGPKNGMNRDVLVHRLYGATRLGGKLYRVKITLKENVKDKEANKAYSYEATKIELLEGTISKTEGSRDLEPSNSKPELSAGQHEKAFGLTSTFSRYSDNSIAAAKLLKGVEKTYEPGKKLLDESEKSSKDGALYRESDNQSATESKERNVASRVKKAVEGLHKDWKRSVSETAQMLGLDGVEVVEDAEGLSERERKAKGWFDVETGRIVVVLGNHRSKGDVMMTVLHEGCVILV